MKSNQISDKETNEIINTMYALLTKAIKETNDYPAAITSLALALISLSKKDNMTKTELLEYISFLIENNHFESTFN